MICERTLHTASQLRLNAAAPPRCAPPPPPARAGPPPPPRVCPALDTWPSNSIPVGLVPKIKAFWSSSKVSRRIWMESVSSSSPSRRFCVTTMFSGCESKQMMPKYRLRSSKAMRISVRSAETLPSSGFCWMKSVATSRSCQKVSLTRPSRLGGSAIRCARSCLDGCASGACGNRGDVAVVSRIAGHTQGRTVFM